MKQFWTAALLGATIASLPSVAANATTFSFTSTLTGSQEVPPSGSSAEGFATATLEGDPTSWSFNYIVQFSNLTGPLVLAHIHEAPFGVNGPVVHSLDNPPFGVTSGTIVGNWLSTEVAADPAETFAELLAGNYYFNLHSEPIPSGEIRGQIEQAVESVPEPTSALGLVAFGVLGVGFQLKKSQNKRKSTSGSITIST